MEILVCDSNQETCRRLEDTILAYASGKDIVIGVGVFYSEDALREHFAQGGAPDLLFLEAGQRSKEEDGIGSLIREWLRNEHMLLVYLLSDWKDVSWAAWDSPFQFLKKPLGKKDIFKLMDKALQLLHNSDCYLEFHDKRSWNWVPYRDILYLQSEGKKINVIMRDGIKSFYGKLSECKVQADYFLNIHKSCMVNCHYIAEYVREEIKMVNGHVLSISKANRAEVRKKIMQIDRNHPNWGWRTLGRD